MGPAREPLCPRCGSAVYEQISARESRCVECGLGRTSTPLRLEHRERSVSERVSSAVDLPDPLAEVRRRALTNFAEASFAPCGLDDRWEGTRWFGGSGASDGTITRLELAHGDDPWEEGSTQVRVEVHLPHITHLDHAQRVEFERAMLTRSQVSSYWTATGELAPDVRAAAFPVRAEHHDDPTAPWADAELTVDGSPCAFRILGDDAYWLAQAQHGELLVGVEARAWPVASTGLVTIDDLSPYFAGSELIAARGRRRFD